MTAGFDAGQFRDAIERALRAECSCEVVRVEIAATRPIDPVAWLASRPEPLKVYWSDRRRDFEMAGAGTAVVDTASSPQSFTEVFRALRSRLDPRHPRLRFYGGMAFDRECLSGGAWSAFGSHRFVIPRYEVFRDGSVWHFACNWPRGNAELGEILRDLKLCVPGNGGQDVPRASAREDNPDRAGWIKKVESVLDAIRAGRVEKAVMARETRFAPADNFSPTGILRRLRDQDHGSYLFYFQPAMGTAFLSVSPERLCACAKDRVESEALAGTRPRGASATADAALSEELLHDDKELREHQAVVAGIRAVYEQYCGTLRLDRSLRVARLRDCQHLVCRIEGRLRDPNEAGLFMEALHPTPAVGGAPTGAALALIRQLESFARGWYAGPIGWVGANAFEFAVGIRACRIEPNTATLYAGAGIVSGSNPETEWDELETKIQASIRLVRGENNGDG